MKTHDIHHEIGVKASPDAIYKALTDIKKLSGWWTTDTRGDSSKVGSQIEFWFGEHCLKAEVTSLKPNEQVRWRPLAGFVDSEWVGTEIGFDLSKEGDQVWVHFSHSGWKDIKGTYPHCSMKWAVFMLSLKDLLEKGKGQPAPNDVSINHS